MLIIPELDIFPVVAVLETVILLKLVVPVNVGVTFVKSEPSPTKNLAYAIDVLNELVNVLAAFKPPTIFVPAVLCQRPGRPA